VLGGKDCYFFGDVAGQHRQVGVPAGLYRYGLGFHPVYSRQRFRLPLAGLYPGERGERNRRTDAGSDISVSYILAARISTVG